MINFRNKKIVIFVIGVVLSFAALGITFAAAAEHGRFRREQIGIAVPYLPDSLNPLFGREPITRLIFANIGASLAKLNRDGKATLDLGDKISHSDDGLTWTVELQQTHWLSTERRLRADDIKASFELLREQAKNNDEQIPPRIAQSLAQITSIEVSAKPREFAREAIEEKVVFALAEPDEDFAETVLTLPILDAQLLRTFGETAYRGTNIPGSGPYEVMEHRPGEAISLVDRENFLRPDAPHSPTLSFERYPDADAALSALRVGSVDVVPLPTEKIIEAAQADSTLEVIHSPLEVYAKAAGPWLLKRGYWSNKADPKDTIVTSLMVVRRSLKLDTDAKVRFNLSDTTSP